MSDSVRPQRRQPTRLPTPWDSPGKNTGVGCHFLIQCMKVKNENEVAQSCPTLHDPMDCSPPGSSVHRILQARVLEWGAIAFSGTIATHTQNLSKNMMSNEKKNPERLHWVVIPLYFLNRTTIPQLLVYIELLADPDSFFRRKTGESQIQVQKTIFHENVLIIPKKAR